jgi:hypothetical protein
MKKIRVVGSHHGEKNGGLPPLLGASSIKMVMLEKVDGPNRHDRKSSHVTDLHFS